MICSDERLNKNKGAAPNAASALRSEVVGNSAVAVRSTPALGGVAELASLGVRQGLDTVEKIYPRCALHAFISPKTDLSREGIVAPTTQVDAGYHGTLNWTITNSSSEERRFLYGERLYRLTILKLEAGEIPLKFYEGDYQGQTGYVRSQRKGAPVRMRDSEWADSTVEGGPEALLDNLIKSGYPWHALGQKLKAIDEQFKIVTEEYGAIHDSLKKFTLDVDRHGEVARSIPQAISTALKDEAAALQNRWLLASGSMLVALLGLVISFTANQRASDFLKANGAWIGIVVVLIGVIATIITIKAVLLRSEAEPATTALTKSLERTRAGHVSGRFGHAGPPASLQFCRSAMHDQHMRFRAVNLITGASKVPHLIGVAILFLIAISSYRSVAETPVNRGTVIELWPEGAPNSFGGDPADRPTLRIFRPPNANPTGAAVVICPGGAYVRQAMDHEGVQVARRFNRIGVAAAVLKYRLAPRYRHPAPLQDAERAIRYLRFKAVELGLATNRIGIVGFSAGGHLAALVGAYADDGNPDADDPVERHSARADFVVTAYPVIKVELANPDSPGRLLGNNLTEQSLAALSIEKHVSANFPPTFLFHADDDSSVPAEHSIALYQALRRANVPAEIHIFGQGGHGARFAEGNRANRIWPDLLFTWMRQRGFLTSKPRVSLSVRVFVDGEPVQVGQISFIPVDANCPTASAFLFRGRPGNIPAANGPCVGRHRIEVRQLALRVVDPEPSIEDALLFTKKSPSTPEELICELRQGDNSLVLDIRTK